MEPGDNPQSNTRFQFGLSTLLALMATFAAVLGTLKYLGPQDGVPQLIVAGFLLLLMGATFQRKSWIVLGMFLMAVMVLVGILYDQFGMTQ